MRLDGILPSFPLLGAVLAATAVLVGVWIVPAQAGSHEEQIPFGEPHILRWSAVGNRDAHFEWAYEADLPRTDEGLRYLPSLPFTIKPTPGPHAKESNLRLDIEFLFNGASAYRSIFEDGIREGQDGGVTLRSAGVPYDGSEVDFSALREGHNTITIRAAVTMTVKEADSSYYDIRVGAPWIRAYHVDADRDGVLDHKQLLPIHTALIALPAMAGAGALGWFGGSRLQQWLLATNL